VQVDVRMSASAQLHQLCLLVSPERGRNALVRPLLKLLADPSHAVLGKLLPTLGTIVTRLTLVGGGLKDFQETLVATEATFGHNWRLTHALALAFDPLGTLLGPDSANDVLIPIAFRYLMSGPAVVIDDSAAGLVVLFRRLRQEKQRTEVRQECVNACCLVVDTDTQAFARTPACKVAEPFMTSLALRMLPCIPPCARQLQAAHRQQSLRI
jgi:hypothetical protein